MLNSWAVSSFHVAHNMLHVISARCVARDLYTTAPWPLESKCWRQFAAQWGNCTNLELCLSMWSSSSSSSLWSPTCKVSALPRDYQGYPSDTCHTQGATISDSIRGCHPTHRPCTWERVLLLTTYNKFLFLESWPTTFSTCRIKVVELESCSLLNHRHN